VAAEKNRCQHKQRGRRGGQVQICDPDKEWTGKQNPTQAKPKIGACLPIRRDQTDGDEQQSR